MAGLIGLATLLGAGWCLFQFDPARHTFYPRCLFRWLTGWDCPGCGGLRATHELLHGNLAAAWQLNPLVPLLPALVGLVWLAQKRNERRRKLWPPLLIGGLIVFGIVRNLKP